VAVLLLSQSTACARVRSIGDTSTENMCTSSSSILTQQEVDEASNEWNLVGHCCWQCICECAVQIKSGHTHYVLSLLFNKK